MTLNGTNDAELRAIEAVIRAFEPLPDDARYRVIEGLASRYNIDLKTSN